MKNILSLLIIIFLASCSSQNIHFNKNVEKSLEVNGIDLKSVQFKIDQKLTLRREISKTESKPKNGIISIKNGKYIETIMFPRLTPGILMKKDGNSLKLAFDSVLGSELQFISFYDMDYQLFILPNSKVIYQGLEYDLYPINSKLPKLLITNSYLNSIKQKNVTVKGMKVKN